MALHDPVPPRADGATARAGSGAWTEAVAEPVAPGVHRLPLPLPGDGLKAVNVYAVEDGDGIALVDAGWHREDSWRALERGLHAAGARIGDVRRVLVTHIHHDHYGQAPRLRGASGAVILLGQGERRSLELILHDHDRSQARRLERLEANGAADLVARLRHHLAQAEPESVQEGRAVWEMPDRWAAHGDVVALGGRAVEVVETPGHTRGHVSFLDRERGLLFAGDHVLPHITPSLGVEPVSEGLPLVEFIASLVRVRELPASLVLPAHGPVFDDLVTRVDELLAHHADRLQACIAAVDGGGRSAHDVAQALPWTRRNRRYQDLDLFNQVLAVGETAAHLELLATQGTLARSERDGVVEYRRTGTA